MSTRRAGILADIARSSAVQRDVGPDHSVQRQKTRHQIAPPGRTQQMRIANLPSDEQCSHWRGNGSAEPCAHPHDAGDPSTIGGMEPARSAARWNGRRPLRRAEREFGTTPGSRIPDQAVSAVKTDQEQRCASAFPLPRRSPSSHRDLKQSRRRGQIAEHVSHLHVR